MAITPIIPIEPIRAVTSEGFKNVNALTISGGSDNYVSCASVNYSIGTDDGSTFTPVYHGELKIDEKEYPTIDWARKAMIQWVCKKLDLIFAADTSNA